MFVSQLKVFSLKEKLGEKRKIYFMGRQLRTVWIAPGLWPGVF